MPDYMKPARGRQAEGRQGRRYAAMRRNPQWFARQAAFTDKNFVFFKPPAFPACIAVCRVYCFDIADLTINLRAIKKYS
jgi:hypothetical protein